MLGNRIQRLRKERKLTLSQLAAKTAISKSYLSHMERNIQKNPSIEVLTKLAMALEVDIQTLIISHPGSKKVGHANEKDWTQLINDGLKSGVINDQVLQQLMTSIREGKKKT